jgi:alpha-tubulin suppressor-like RCC1 family protein
MRRLGKLFSMRRSRTLLVGAAAACALAGPQVAPAAAVEGSVLGAGYAIGDGTFEQRPLPTPVTGLSDVLAVAGSLNGGYALRSEGTVEAWGNNELGQLGQGTTTGRAASPVLVKGLGEVTAISAQGNFCLALLSNGTVVAWGANEHGQLGDGTTETRTEPVPVSGLENVVAIAAGKTHSLALLSSGEVRAWGAGAHGQLGNGTTADSSTPVAVSGLSGVTAIAAGSEHSLALTSAGAVWSWGRNEHGQLGNGGTTDATTPGAVSGLSGGITAIAAGGTHSLALHLGGTVLAWGQNNLGQIGIGTADERPITEPVEVHSLSTATAISAGWFTSMALRSDGTVVSWGENTFGQLGIGGGTSSAQEPIQMCEILSAGGVAGGNQADYVYGVTSTLPCPTVTSVSPARGPQAGGTTVTIEGTHLDEATEVLFGDASTTSFEVLSPTQLRVVTPAEVLRPGGNGFEHVRVRTAQGFSPYGVQFQYMPPPKLTKLKPKKGPASGGTTVTINGQNIIGEAITVQAVRFGSVEAASFEVKYVKGVATITAVSPSAAAGTVDVTIETNWGTSATSTADHFKFLPVVEGVSPASGSKAGGYSVTVHGAGFAPGTTFKFGTAKSKSASCASLTECTVLVPAHALGTVDVIATANKAKGEANPPADHFTYE